MKAIIRIVIVVAVMAAIAAWIYRQQTTIDKLMAENALLHDQVEQAEKHQPENARTATAPGDSAELERLRAEHAELLRLRAEVTRLQGLLKDMSSKSGTPARGPAPSASTTPTAAPVDTYAASVRATVTWKQAVVTGGWSVGPGKRAIVLVQPELMGAETGASAGQILLRTQVLVVPDETLNQPGLQDLRSDYRDTIAQTVLSAEQADALNKMLAKTPGVEYLAAPKVMTVDGRQAQIKVSDTKTLPSGETYETGPVVDIIPQVSHDRSSVDLGIAAQLRMPSNPAH